MKKIVFLMGNDLGLIPLESIKIFIEVLSCIYPGLYGSTK